MMATWNLGSAMVLISCVTRFGLVTYLHLAQAIVVRTIAPKPLAAAVT